MNDIRPVRGRCRGGTKRKPCPSRWAIPRVSLDFRDPARVDRLATLECAVCGRTWRRIAPIAIRSREGYQSALLTVIVSATAHRWYSRGTWHREGDDAQVVVDARLDDVDEAVSRNDRAMALRAERAARARARREAADLEAVARLRATLASMDARRADEARAEAEAQAREAAYR
jgi:hypothetical protein